MLNARADCFRLVTLVVDARSWKLHFIIAAAVNAVIIALSINAAIIALAPDA